MTIEYRLRPVTRFAVTRFESGENSGSSRTLGEYDNKDVAYEVGYALAKAESDRLQLPSDSMEVIYPVPFEAPGASQVKEMAERFLRWKLPANFNPDGGVSFTAEYNVEYNAARGQPPARHELTGTNLFGYTEAVEMVRYMLDLDALRD